MPISRLAALAAVLCVCVFPAAADTIGKEVKLSRAEIATGQVLVDGKGRSQQFYRLVSSTGAVLGTPYKSKPAGGFWISGGSVHPGSCTIGLQTSPTNTATSKWKAVTGGILLGNCNPAGANPVTVTKTCDTEHDDEWAQIPDYENQSVGEKIHVCHVACPFGSEPLTASTIVTQINGDERNVSFEQITAHNAFDLATAKALGVRQWDQFVAMYKGNIDPSWFTVVKVSMTCTAP